MFSYCLHHKLRTMRLQRKLLPEILNTFFTEFKKESLPCTVHMASSIQYTTHEGLQNRLLFAEVFFLSYDKGTACSNPHYKMYKT